MSLKGEQFNSGHQNLVEVGNLCDVAEELGSDHRESFKVTIQLIKILLVSLLNLRRLQLHRLEIELLLNISYRVTE